MRTLFRKGMIAASVSALLFLGGLPGQAPWQDGFSAAGQAVAAGGKGGGHASGGSGGGHDSDSHSDDSHDDSHSSHDDGHDSSDGKKGKGPSYRGGRVGSSKGRGGPAQATIDKIFENE